jgi:hypothetical protein
MFCNIHLLKKIEIQFTDAYTYIHMCIHAYNSEMHIHTYTCAYMHTHAQASLRMTHACMLKLTYVYMLKHRRSPDVLYVACVYANAYVCIYAQTQAHRSYL